MSVDTSASVTEPDPPPIGFKIMSGNYVAKAGSDLFWNKSAARWEDVQAAGGYSAARMNAEWIDPPYFIAARVVDPYHQIAEVEQLRADADRWRAMRHYAQSMSHHMDGTCDWRFMRPPMPRARTIEEAMEPVVEAVRVFESWPTTEDLPEAPWPKTR